LSKPRTEAPALRVEREDVPGACPACGAEALRRYPVLSEGGWFMVTKCQECLSSVTRERWHRLGALSLLEDQL
jgi:hypothetical protein